MDEYDFEELLWQVEMAFSDDQLLDYLLLEADMRCNDEQWEIICERLNALSEAT